MDSNKIVTRWRTEFQDVPRAQILVDDHEKLAAKDLVFYCTIINIWRCWETLQNNSEWIDTYATEVRTEHLPNILKKILLYFLFWTSKLQISDRRPPFLTSFPCVCPIPLRQMTEQCPQLGYHQFLPPTFHFAFRWPLYHLQLHLCLRQQHI